MKQIVKPFCSFELSYEGHHISLMIFPLSIKKLHIYLSKNSIIYSIIYSSYLHIWLKVNGMEFSYYLTKLCYCVNIDY